MNRIKVGAAGVFSALAILAVSHCIGCSSGDSPGDCPEALALTEDTDLQTLLPSGDWSVECTYESSILPVSTDLETEAETLLDSDILAVPSNCAERADCRLAVRFRMPSPVAGVTLEEPADEVEMGWLGSFAKLRASAGTAFRLRAVLFDTHPELYNFVPLLQVLPPCSAECGAQERRCDLDRVCYPAGEQTCLRCSTLPVEVCACQIPTGPAPTGQECDFFVSGDVMVSGACEGGECRQ